MKRLILIVVVAIVLMIPFIGQAVNVDYEWQVREQVVDVIVFEGGQVVKESCIGYFLYYGNDATYEFSNQMYDAGITARIFIYRPALAVIRSREAVPGNWYLELIDTMTQTIVNTAYAKDSVYSYIPNFVKYTIKGITRMTSLQLIVVSYDLLTQSVGIVFHYRWDTNRKFYERKLKKLIKYLDKVNLVVEPKMPKFGNVK